MKKAATARFLPHLAVFILALTALSPVSAQQITGSITGNIRDGQRALVTTATVKATNVETGLSRSVHAGSDGAYLIQYLPVGEYTLEARAPGFKKFVQQHLVVTVDVTATDDITLSIGDATEVVTVSDAPPLIQTTTSELGTTLLHEEIVGMPLVNHNAYAELDLIPGVMSNSASATTNPSGSPNYFSGQPVTQVAFNGGIDGGVPTVSFYLDGGLNMTSIRNYGNPIPNPEALQEFRVETSNFSAQYGKMSGAVITVVTRSGANRWHGGLFEFNRNTDLNARNWNVLTKSPYHRNQFGAELGGPIKHDKAFFFFSYAGLRQVIGQSLSGATTPTAAERLGDFTADTFKVYNPKPVGVSAAAWDVPANRAMGTNSSSHCQTPTLNCVNTVAIPNPANPGFSYAYLDPTAANLINQYIPLPNNGKTYLGTYVAPTNQQEYLGKFDEILSDKDHLSASYFFLKGFQDAYGGGNIPYTTNESYSQQQNVNLSEIHEITPNTTNQAWGTFTRVSGGRVNLPVGKGLDDLGSTFTTQGDKGLPYLNVSGDFTAGGSFAGPITVTDFYSLRDLVSKNIGKHSLFFGGEASLEKYMAVSNLYNYGYFVFTSSAPTSTGNSLSDFLTGQVSSMEQDTPYHSLMTDWNFAAFLQDNYRIRPNLTLNLGLRWDLQTSPVESQNLAATFVPGVQSTVVPGAPLGQLFPGDAGVPRGLAANRYHHVSPRVGLAWDPWGDGKTAIRAAAGVFYGSVSGNEWNQPANGQPFSVRQTFSSITSLTNVYGDPTAFPHGDPFPYTYNPSKPRYLSAAGIEAISKDYQWPLAYQLNAAVQRQLPLNVSVTAAYVATLSHHLPFMTDLNYAAYAPGASTSQASLNSRRPYDPGVLGQITYAESNETASYHSLQIIVNKPFTHNISLGGYYVLSHGFQSVNEQAVGQATAQDFDNLWEERGPMDTDVRHRAVIRARWLVDYYHGNRVVKQVLNGWTISPIVTLHSGTPFTVVTGTNRNFDSASANRPNLVPGVSPFLDPHRTRTAAAKEWFNTAAFSLNGPGLGIGPGGADGNEPRDYLRAPGFRTVDLGLFRNFNFEHGIVFQIRGEATNVLNMVSLGTPTANMSNPTTNGQIFSAANPRLIQVGARLTF